MRFSLVLASLALCGLLCSTGCEPKKVPVVDDHAGHDHEHDDHAGHDHSHDHGPNGGHIAHFEPSEVHFEWTHDDEAHQLSVHVEELVSGGAKIESMEVVVASGKEVTNFELKKDDKAKIADSVYTITNQELLTLIGASGADPKGVQAKLVAKIDGKTQTCLLVDDDHGHGHKH